MNVNIVAATCGAAIILSGCQQTPEQAATGNAVGESGFFKSAGRAVAQTCEGGGIVTNDEVSVTGSVDLRNKPGNTGDKIVNRRPAAFSALPNISKSTTANGSRRFAVRRLVEGSGARTRLAYPCEWLDPVKSLRAIQRDSSGKRTYVEADFTWDNDTKAYKPKLVAAVNRIVRDNSRCPTIDPGTLSKSGNRGSPGKPVFYVTCQGDQPFNVWFEPPDAADMGKSFAAIRNVDRGNAVLECERAAKEAANNPQTVSFSRFMDLAYVPYANGNTRIISSFTAKNAFGVESKFRIECFFEGSTMTERNIEEDRT